MMTLMRCSRWTPPLCALPLMFGISGELRCQDWIYTVRPGDNLWTISEDYLSSMRYWRPLQRHNGVDDPEHMPPGMRLRVPVRWLRIQPAAGRLAQTRGDVRVLVGSGLEERKPAPNQLLHAGDGVRTGPGASATIEFADGSRLLVEEESQVVMDRLTAYKGTGMVDTRMRMPAGRVESRVTGGSGAGARYELTTPAATSAVRGTEYRVSMNEAEAISRTEVLSGRVGVSAYQKTRSVSAGFGIATRLGERPGAPVRLLPAPDVSGLPNVVERLPIRLELPPVAGAVSYRLQVAATEDFATLLDDRTSDKPLLRGPDLPDGDYVLRVRAIDRMGLEGSDAYHRFTVNARPEPPLLMDPPQGTTVRVATPTFQWSAPEGARAYHYQLAQRDRFVKPEIDLPEQRGARLTVDEPLDPGEYYWRVATRDLGGEQGPFGDPQQFTLRPAPPAPALQVPNVDKKTLTFRWAAGLEGQQYQLQMAVDRGFEDLLVDARLTRPEFSMDRPEAGSYYLRVRTIDTDGFAGPFGSAQRVDLPPESLWPIAIIIVTVVLLAL